MDNASEERSELFDNVWLCRSTLHICFIAATRPADRMPHYTAPTRPQGGQTSNSPQPPPPLLSYLNNTTTLISPSILRRHTNSKHLSRSPTFNSRSTSLRHLRSNLIINCPIINHPLPSLHRNITSIRPSRCPSLRSLPHNCRPRANPPRHPRGSAKRLGPFRPSISPP